MKVPKEVRNRIYRFLFFTKGQGSQAIVIDGKRKFEPKDPYAKSFSEGSKFRVAILAVNREVIEYFPELKGCLELPLTTLRSTRRPLQSCTVDPSAARLLPSS